MFNNDDLMKSNCTELLRKQSRETSNQIASTMTFELENPVASVPNLFYTNCLCNPIVLVTTETESTN